MKRVAVLIIFSCTLSFQSGCSNLNRNLSNLFFPPNPNSDIRDGENVHLKLVFGEMRDVIAEKRKKGVAAGVAIPGAAAVLGFAFTEVQKFLQEEAKRYSASYSAVAVSDIFYNDWDKKASINLEGMHFSRTVKDVKPAMELCLKVEPTLDNTAFQIKPIHIVIRKAKAKLIAFDWLSPLGFDLLAPWTIFKNDWSTLFDNDVDLKVQFTLYGVWVDEKQKGHTDLLASQEIRFPNTKLGDEGIKFVDFSADSTCDKVVERTDLKPTPAAQKNPFMGQLFQAVPRSVIDEKQGVYGTGNFILTILVTEYDQFGERVKELGTKIEEHKTDWTKKIMEAF